MTKRFHDTDIWHEDWFIALPKDYRYFWLYIKDDCDHAGIWRPKVAGFNKLYECNIQLSEAILLFNQDRNGDKRVEVLPNGRWFLNGFIPFQYGTVLNLASRMHLSVYSLLNDNEVNLTSIRPQVEVIQRVKDKDKDKDIFLKDGKSLKTLKTNTNITIDDCFNGKSAQFMEVFNRFVEMRISIKRKMTDYAKSLIIAKLDKLAPSDEKTQIEILNQSIESGWIGVFALKKDHTETPKVSYF